MEAIVLKIAITLMLSGLVTTLISVGVNTYLEFPRKHWSSKGVDLGFIGMVSGIAVLMLLGVFKLWSE